MAKPKWYAAVLIFGFDGPETDDPRFPRVHHEIRLIQAVEDEAAYERALFLGRSQEREYKNVHGDTVRFEFLGLHDLVWLYDTSPDTGKMVDTEPGDGVRVYQFKLPPSHAWPVQPKEELTPFYDVVADFDAWCRLGEERDAEKFTGPKLFDPGDLND